MFDNALAFFNGVEVKQENPSTVRILGMKTEPFIAELEKLWKTSRISAYMFRRVRSRQIDIHPFFLPDFYYICKRLMNERRARINRTAVGQIITQLENNTWLRSAFTAVIKPKLDYKALDRMAKPPLPHQNEFLRWYDDKTQMWGLDGYILGAAPGSGKTYTGCALSECLNTDITICVVPKNSAIDVWESTMHWAFKTVPTYWNSARDEPLRKGCRYYIVHYEQLEKALEFFKTGHDGKKFNIILDESHNFSDLKSLRTELFIQLCKVTKCKDVLYSSGTPLKAMGSEVIPILRVIDPIFDKETEERFKAIYGLSSSRGLDILAHRIGYMTFKVKKEDVVGNKVERLRVDVTLKNGADYTLQAISNDMSKFIKERTAYYQSNMKQYLEWYSQGLRAHERTLKNAIQIREFEEYVRTARLLHTSYDPYIHKQEPIFCNAYEKKYILPNLPKELRENFKNSRSVYKYVKLKIQGEALGRILGRKRTQCNIDMLSAWADYRVTDTQSGETYTTTLVDIIDNSIKKTVLFTSYVEVVDRAAEILKEAGGYPLKVYGDTNSELSQIITTFERDTRCNALVATLQSLSTAVPLVMANTVIFLNAPFRDYEYDQACSRVDRLGQTEVVYIYDVYLDTGKEPNISTRSMDIMKWSKDMVDQMMGISGGVAALENLEDVGDDVKQYLPIAGVSEAQPEMSNQLVAANEGFSW